jgi:hypothetical protein
MVAHPATIEARLGLGGGRGERIWGFRLRAFSYKGSFKTTDELDNNGDTFDDLSDRKVRSVQCIAKHIYKDPRGKAKWENSIATRRELNDNV